MRKRHDQHFTYVYYKYAKSKFTCVLTAFLNLHSTDIDAYPSEAPKPNASLPGFEFSSRLDINLHFLKFSLPILF